jgi:hypothetical protein
VGDSVESGVKMEIRRVSDSGSVERGRQPWHRDVVTGDLQAMWFHAEGIGGSHAADGDEGGEEKAASVEHGGVGVA